MIIRYDNPAYGPRVEGAVMYTQRAENAKTIKTHSKTII